MKDRLERTPELRLGDRRNDLPAPQESRQQLHRVLRAPRRHGKERLPGNDGDEVFVCHPEGGFHEFMGAWRGSRMISAHCGARFRGSGLPVSSYFDLHEGQIVAALA
jgi:hypothetical protein